MKKVFILFSLLMMALCANCQESVVSDSTQVVGQDTSLVVKTGRHYMVNNQIMSEGDLIGFFQTQDELACKMLRKGRKTKIAGWALFGAGLLVTSVGVPLIVAGLHEMDADYEVTDAGDVVGSIFMSLSAASAYMGGIVFSSIGAAVTTSGIVCLAVGYSQVKDAVKYYNGTVQKRKPAVSLNLQSSSDGIGLALRF